LIGLIADWVCLQFPTAADQPLPLALCGPTGISAFAIGGQTVHRLLAIRVQRGQIARYRKLSPIQQKNMRSIMGKIRVLIVDEISMVSNVNFNMMQMRLQELFSDSDPG
jgi:hypothetical protein